MNKTTSLLASVILVGISVACMPKPAADEAEASESSDVARQDAYNAETFNAGQEARAWLARDDTTLFEIDKDYGSQIVEDFYAAGSPKVVMADAMMPSEGSKVEVGATFIVELPSEPEKRKRVFEVQRKHFEDDVDKDLGQKYMLVTTD